MKLLLSLPLKYSGFWAFLSVLHKTVITNLYYS